MNPTDLADLLRYCTAGGEKAAVNLLAAQGHWMREMAERSDDMALHVFDIDGGPWAEVDWTALGDRFTNGELIGSPGENAVMQVALSLAGYPMALNALQYLDAANTRLVLAAVAQAANHPEVLQP